jgi:hypothetical protein
MAHQKERGSLIQNILNGRQGGFDALVVGHFAVCHGHVEINAHEHALAFEVEVFDSLFIHGVVT